MKPKKNLLTLLVALSFLNLPFSARAGSELPPLHIHRVDEKIIIDGMLDETVWETAEIASDFMQYFPFDTAYAKAQTEVRIIYDENFIYIGAKMYNLPGERGYVTPSLRRDYRGEANDGITVILDPFQDYTNAFQFGVNPFGVQREGLIANGGTGQGSLTLSWDNRWFAEAKRYDGYWVAEMAIPFRTIRYKEGSRRWNINFYRIDSEYGERSTWSPIPRNFSIVSLAFLRELVWDEPLQRPGGNIAVIPYMLGSVNQDFLDTSVVKTGFNAGGDAKVGLGPALNLDLTFNPDFSQVEVDEQVTNLDRFELFFPERRQFFLENGDLFADFGQERLRPFFSRRIGIASDPETGTTDQNTIYYGARLSGKIDNNWRVGLMNMQTAKDEELRTPATNFTVAALQRKVLGRSNIGAIFINKQPFRVAESADTLLREASWNRTLGLDFNLLTKDNRWSGKAFMHYSFDKDQGKSPLATAVSLNYSVLRWEFDVNAQFVGEGYNPEVGFVRRKDYLRSNGTVNRYFYPKSGIINRHGPGFDFDVLGNNTYGVTDWDLNILYSIKFQNTSELRMRLRREYVYLFDEFDPTNTEGVPLPADTDYAYNLIIARYDSDRRKPFYFSASTRSGGYFNGNRLNLEGEVGYRFQPYGSITMNFSYNRIRLPDPHNDADLLLIGPRIDITFTRSLFWTTFIQYNNQIDNVNINSRLQWRFAPVSDVFLVYTDNYYPSNITVKTRSIVLKVTYWLNV